MQIERIDHLDITVEDPGALAAFLLQMGFEQIRVIDDRGIIEVRLPGGSHQPFLVLHPTIEPNGRTRPLGLDHIALKVDDLPGAYDELVARGLNVNGAPRTTGSGRTLTNVLGPQFKVQLV